MNTLRIRRSGFARTLALAAVAATGVAHAAPDPAAAAPPASAASASELLQSVQCKRAMEALERQTAASAPLDGKRDDAELERDALRQQAARACLGGKGDAPPPKRTGRAPISPTAPIAVPPVAIGRPAPRAADTVVPPAAQTPLAAVVTSCDAAGCWASDGSRLDRVGAAAYRAPRGLCHVEAGIVRCP